MEWPILGGTTRTEKFSTFGLEVTAAFTLASAESITIASKLTDSATAILLCPYHRLTVVSLTFLFNFRAVMMCIFYVMVGYQHLSGTITDKNILPITRLSFGRTLLESSSGIHTLGRFECTGQVAVNGIPKSCADLWRMGHTLSGLYSVMGTKQMESVYCDFTKLPEDSGRNCKALTAQL